MKKRWVTGGGRADAMVLVLASSSPRRCDLLASLGLEFEIHVPEIDESPLRT